MIEVEGGNAQGRTKNLRGCKHGELSLAWVSENNWSVAHATTNDSSANQFSCGDQVHSTIIVVIRADGGEGRRQTIKPEILCYICERAVAIVSPHHIHSRLTATSHQDTRSEQVYVPIMVIVDERECIHLHVRNAGRCSSVFESAVLFVMQEQHAARG